MHYPKAWFCSNGCIKGEAYKYMKIGRFQNKKKAHLVANFQSFDSHKFVCSLAQKFVNLERDYSVVSCELSFANSRENTTQIVVVFVKYNLLVELEVRCKLFKSKICVINKSGV